MAMSESTTTELLQAIHDLGQRMENRFTAIEAVQHRQAEAVAERRGEMRGLSTRFASMDQRFVALMHSL